MRRKGYAEEYLVWLLFFDLSAVAAGLFAAYVFRFDSGLLSTEKGWSPADYLALWPAAVLCWGIGLAQCHAYRPGTAVFDVDVVRRLFVGSVFAVALAVAYVFFARPSEFPYSRYMPVVALVFVFPVLMIERWFFHRILTALAPRQMDRVLIVGSGQVALRLAGILQKQPHHGMVVVGFIADRAELAGAEVAGLDGARFVGHLEKVDEAVQKEKAQQVIIAHAELPFEKIAEIVLRCERVFAECKIVPNLLGTIVPETGVRNVGGIPLFDTRYSPLRGWNVVLKRAFDLAVSTTALVTLSPVMALAAILIKLDSRGPILYKQQRIGLDGRRFNLYKFRSMRQDAEQASGPVMTAENDERCTQLGRVLRRTNLDELPQFFNVWRGDMSLVGPRPERPYFVKKFRDEIPGYMRRHRVKCGITGWAQVNGLRGAETSMEDRIAYDLYYIENWSLWLDIKILILTLGALKNAY